MHTTTSLLTHQHPAVDKLLPIRVGALFMEMGTGKSRTAIEMAVRRQERVWNVVWFCPVSLKETIRVEILKHTDATPEDIHVFNGRTNGRNLPDVDWHVIGIESMSASRRVILAANALIRPESFVIVDESSYIKGHRAARTDWITRIAERARYRLILTGTPISQGVVDLFAQMRFLSPKILGYRSFYSFAANHLEYSERFPGLIVRTHNTKWIAAKIQPYVYQVTKEECLDLPEKLYESHYLTMSGEQRDAYEQAKQEIFEAYAEAEDWDSYLIFRLFNVLQQIVCGFWNRTTGPGQKLELIELKHYRLDALRSSLEKIAANEKVIIWAKYRYDLTGIMAMLEQVYGTGCAVDYHGGYTERKRTAQIALFRGQARHFAATPSSAGHGLTLNEANHVIYYNNGFKYAERLQTEDRCHRIGQDKPVTYLDMICSDSIDVRISNSLWAKGNAVADFKAEVDKVKKKKNRKDRLEELVRGL